MIRVDGAGPQNLDLPRDSRAADSNTSGAWRGESVKVADTSRSVLQDAAEEITFGHSEKVEEKHLAERKVHAEGNVRLVAIEEITAYLAQMHREDAQAKLEDTAKRVINGRRDGASPREEARRSFEDVTEQYCALQYAAHRGAQEGADPTRLEAVHDAIAGLEEDFGPKLRAGLAAAAGARDYAKDAVGAAEFRETYRDVVLGHTGLGDTFLALVESHGLEEIPRIVPALVKSLGEDLSAVRPSREPARLQAILHDLYNLHVATTLMEQCERLSQKQQETFGTGFDAMQVTREAIALTNERWVSASRLTTLGGQFGGSEPPSQRAFLTGMRAMLNDLPVKIFTDPETREALLKAAQGALDEAIDREEQIG